MAKQQFSRLWPKQDARKFVERNWLTRMAFFHGPPSRIAHVVEDPSLASAGALCKALPGQCRAMGFDRTGRFREMDIDTREGEQFFEAGMSLCFTAIDRHVPRLRTWLDAISAELGVPRAFTQVNAYASPKGAGLAPHFDSQEVMIVQVQGSKTWKVAENTAARWPHHNYGPLAAGPAPSYLRMQEGKRIQMRARSVRMRPGSVLFVPRGFWHETKANADSLSLTLTFFPPSWLEALLFSAATELVERAEWRKPALELLGHGSRGDRQEELQHRLRALAQTLAAQGSKLDELSDLVPRWTPRQRRS